MFNPIKWLLTKAEPANKETTVTDTTATTEPVTATTTVEPTATTLPAAGVKAGVADFETALSFVESGIAHLGEAAKDELVALAKKYL